MSELGETDQRGTTVKTQTPPLPEGEPRETSLEALKKLAEESSIYLPTDERERLGLIIHRDDKEIVQALESESEETFVSTVAWLNRALEGSLNRCNECYLNKDLKGKDLELWLVGLSARTMQKKFENISERIIRVPSSIWVENIGDTDGQLECLRVMSHLVRHNSDTFNRFDFQDRAREVIFRNRGPLLDRINEESSEFRFQGGYVQLLLELTKDSYLKKDQKQEVLAIFAHAIEDALTDPLKDNDRINFLARQEVIFETEGIVLKPLLEHFGLDYSKTRKAWEQSCSREREDPRRLGNFWRKAVEDNSTTLVAIEKERPGIARFLNSEYGIYCFGRYPPEMLIRQYDAFKNNDSPYGLIVFPYEDHNTTFYGDLNIFEKLFTQTENSYVLRIIEGQSKFDLAKRIIRLDQLYGEKHKVSFVIIGGHGDKESIQLGTLSSLGDEKLNLGKRINIEDFEERGVKRSAQFLEPEATIILFSCSTGAEGGIGQKISEALGCTVIAPEVSTNARSIETQINDGEISFKVEYTKSATIVYSSGTKVT